MKNILDMIFIKNVKINTNSFRNLYYSSDKSSFAGFNLDLLCENKNYDNYEILKELIHDIGESHKEFKAFIKLLDKTYFIRILEDNDSYIYDILMYNAKKEEDYILYDDIFFPKVINIPDSLKDINKPILYVDNHINIIKNEGLFSKYLGYEDWDYKNKCLNMIDVSCLDNIMSDFKKSDIKRTYMFKKNGGEIIKLELNIKYKDKFYYIDKIIVQKS